MSRRYTPAQLEAIAAEAAARFAPDGPGAPSEATAQQVLDWAGETFGAGLAVACSMAGDTVLPHLVAASHPGVAVIFLDTGYHFADTLGTRAELEHAVDIRVIDARPELTVAEQDATHGKDLFASDPTACCAMRKVEPLNRELAHFDAWVTGVRREDNELRRRAPLVEYDASHQMVKINPIAAWTFDDVLAYAEDHAVPINPLLTQGYPSIGCEPCTRRVAPGEDPRAGRWAGLTKTECGIHL